MSEEDLKIRNFSIIKSKNHLEKIKENFEVPEMLKYDNNKENKPITENKIEFEDEGGKDIFTDVLGIVSSPTRTNSIELKKENYS